MSRKMLLVYFLFKFVDCQNISNIFDDYGHYADNRMKAIGEYFSDLMGCGPEGWCAFRCCPTELHRTSPSNRFQNAGTNSFNRKQASGNTRQMSRYPYINRNPAVRTTTIAPTKQCANACMPKCNNGCLQRYNQIVTSFMNSLTAIDVMGQPVQTSNNIRLSPKKTIKCRDECMPYCTSQCLDVYAQTFQRSQPKICKAVCMPECSEECVTAPPLMVPCVFDSVCHCPAGYVRCSELTCCMKYKTMAVRYRNRMTSMSFSDDNDQEDDQKNSSNQTSVYMSELRNMGPNPISEQPVARILPQNSTIVYYPEQGKTEILQKDGSILVEMMEN